MRTYYNSDHHFEDQVSIAVIDEDTVVVELSHTNRLNPALSINLTGEAIDETNGGPKLEELDPSGNSNPVQMFTLRTEKLMLGILLPIEEGLDYIGLWIQRKNDAPDILHERLLLLKN